jgi:hypothetical protein
MKHFDQNLTQETLETYQGYSLQVFTSGRIKPSTAATKTGWSTMGSAPSASRKPMPNIVAEVEPTCQTTLTWWKRFW